jgi:divalent metal cation (Fe/Co/Zn/Cd) transporter
MSVLVIGFPFLDTSLVMHLATVLAKMLVGGFFHSCTMHLDAIKVVYLPTDAQ